MRLTWPLTGRAEEMRLIESTLLRSHRSGIVICGAAGVGKSRIAHEALAAAASNGFATQWVVGTSSARHVLLGAFARWTRSDANDTLQRVGEVIASLTATPTGALPIVGVDDAHLLDDVSTFVVHQLVQRGAAKVVLTVRDDEPIRANTLELWKADQFERLDLQPLSLDETSTLLSETLVGSWDPDAVKRMWKLTRGNVLYLRNIVEQALAERQLVHERGFWRWTGDPVVPPDLLEVLESRMGALPPAVSDVVDLLAVGEPIELGSLTRITDPASVEEADKRGLISLEHVDGRVEVRVAHPLYGEVRRSCAAPTKLRRLRGLIASELAASTNRDDIQVVVRRATLSLDSDLEPDAELLTRAAKGAVWPNNLTLADRLAEAAIRAGGGPEAYLIRAHVLAVRSRGDDAQAVLAELPGAAVAAADHVRVTFLQANNMLWQLADPEGAKALIDDTLDPTSPWTRGCIDAFHAEYCAAMGKPEVALELAKGIAQEELPAFASAVMSWALTIAFGNLGRVSEAVAATERGYEVARSAFDASHMRFVIADAHVGALLLSGRIADALDIAKGLREHAAKLEGRANLYSTAVDGHAVFGAGHLDRASSLLEMVVGLLVASGDTIGWAYLCQIPRTIALAVRGSTDEAVAQLDELEKLRHPSWRFMDYKAGLARAWVEAAQGSTSRAITTTLVAAEAARAKGQLAPEVMCLQTATQFGDTSGVSRLRELEAVMEGPRVGIVARFAAALRDHDGAKLAAVSEDFETMGDAIAALDAAAHAAIAYRQDSHTGSAFTCSARADALAEQCGGASTPALRRATERLPLSEREREIAMLVGQGFSTAAIADMLTLSPRTVEGHIYRAKAKTGATDRDQLAAMLRPRKSGK